jgi:hypothetical protein
VSGGGRGPCRILCARTLSRPIRRALAAAGSAGYPGEVRHCAWLLLPIVLACAPPAPAPVVQRPEHVAAPPPAPAPEPVPPRPSRRGECALGEALDAFLSGQDAVRCGALRQAPSEPDYERARACVLAALHGRAAFAVVLDGPTLDSLMLQAIAGRMSEGRYEVRWFSYDSCPSGCGGDDPQWESVRCDPLTDLRAACKAFGPKKAPPEEELRRLCDEDALRERRRRLELRCEGGLSQETCGPVPR